MNDGLLGFPVGDGRLQAIVSGWPLALQARLPDSLYYGDKDNPFGSAAGVQAAGSPNTKGSWTHLGTPGVDVDGFLICINTADGTVSDHLIDFGRGGGNAPDETIVENMLFCASFNADVLNQAYIPLPFRAGEKLFARNQSTDASTIMAIRPIFLRGGRGRLLKCRRAETYGVNLADSGGTQVDPGGVANTKSAWVEVGVLRRAMRHMLVSVGNLNNATQTSANCAFDIGLGHDPTNNIAIPHVLYRVNADTDSPVPMLFEFELSLPPGTRISFRAQSSTTDATDRLIDFSFIGFD